MERLGRAHALGGPCRVQSAFLPARLGLATRQRDPRAQAGQIARALFDAAGRFQYRRLPEVYGGLARDEGSFPVQYLGANVPQAWASGAIIHLLSALLGLEPDAANKRLVLRPALPDWLDEIELTNLRVGNASVDLRVTRDNVSVTDQRGDLDVSAGLMTTNGPA